MEDIIRKDEELRLAVAALMELGRDRNRLIHEDFAAVALEKTAEEIYQQYKSAQCFVALVGTALRSCSARCFVVVCAARLPSFSQPRH